MAAANFGGANKTGTLVHEQYASARILTATTTLVKSGPGLLASVIVDTNVAASVITIYDALTATGTAIAIITCSGAVPFFLPYNIPFSTGLCIVSSSTAGFVVTYR